MRVVPRGALAGLTALISGCYVGAHLPADAGSASAETSDSDSDGETDGAPQLACDEIGSQPLRRISSAQYRLILRDLLPPTFAQQAIDASTFPDTKISGGFSTYATANTVSTNESIRIEDNAEQIAELFHANIGTVAPEMIPCLPAGFSPGEIDGCIDEFIEDFGHRAFRRPLTENEAAIVRGLYDSIRADGPELGLSSVLQYFLQAPALLYVTEHTSADEEFVALSPDELATRLALLFLDSAPDAELRAAVEDGRLRSKEDVEEQARRLVELPEAKRAFATFHHEWMLGFKLDEAQREHDAWDDASASALRQELREFSRWFFDETDGSLHTLLTTQNFTPGSALSTIYAGGGARPGLMTTAAAMAAQANPEATSLVSRGAFIRNHVLCNPAPPFPGEIDIETPLEGYGELPTARQRLEPLMVESACAACHAAINPLGFPFEVYDWAGAYRERENGETIDASTSIQLGSLSGDFANAAELLEAIAATDDARDCYATHWFRYALGRPESTADSCALDMVTEAFAASDGDIRELLVAIAVSDAFRFKKVEGP